MMFGEEPSPLAARFAQLAHTRGLQKAITLRADGGKPGQGFECDFAMFWRRIERVTAHLQACKAATGWAGWA